MARSLILATLLVFLGTQLQASTAHSSRPTRGKSRAVTAAERIRRSVAQRRLHLPRLVGVATLKIRNRTFAFDRLLGVGANPVFLTTDGKHSIKLMPRNRLYNWLADIWISRYLEQSGVVSVAGVVAAKARGKIPQEVKQLLPQHRLARLTHARVVVKEYRAGLNEHERKMAQGELRHVVDAAEPLRTEAVDAVHHVVTEDFAPWFRTNVAPSVAANVLAEFAEDIPGGLLEMMQLGVDTKAANWLLAPEEWVFIDP